MRRLLLALCLVMLALRGLAGVGMQTTMAMSELHHQAMAALAGSGPDGATEQPDACQGCCEGCQVCDVCHVLVGHPAHWNIPMGPLQPPAPQAPIRPLVSAEVRAVLKPPLFLS